MTRGIIARTDALRRSVLTLALLAGLTATCTANSAFAATASKISSDRALHLSAHDGPSKVEVATLTNNVDQPRSSAEGQLPLGIGLLAVGLLGLVYGLAVVRSTSPAPAPARSPTIT